MKTEVIRVGPDDDVRAVVAAARDALLAAKLVVFASVTIYGLAADAAHPAAIERLRDIKDVAAPKGFTVHIGRKSDAERYVPELPAVGRRLVAKGWPGPITLVFKLGEPSRVAMFSAIPAETRDAVFGEGSLGLRCPDDRVAAAVLGG